jgi:undecaprenyl-diphosphatase
MLDLLRELDRVLFFLINGFLANPVTDAIMPFVTSEDFLKIFYVVIVALLAWRGDKRLRWLILFSIITMVLTDQISSNFLKHWIERPRPCHRFTEIHLLVGCGGGFSMPSSHAANVFGQAFLISRFVKWSRWPLFLFAVSVALSRVFVGVHYPGDILAGAILGTLVAAIVAWWFRMFDRRFLTPSVVEDPEEPIELARDEDEDSV